MRSVTYSMGVSLDGYIAGPDGGFDWTAPDEEVFRFVTDGTLRHESARYRGGRTCRPSPYGRRPEPSRSNSLLRTPATNARHSLLMREQT